MRFFQIFTDFLFSGLGWTGELWLNRVVLILRNKEDIFFFNPKNILKIKDFKKKKWFFETLEILEFFDHFWIFAVFYEFLDFLGFFWGFFWFVFSSFLLLCTPPGWRPGTAEGGERARPGGGHSHFFTNSWFAHIRPRKQEPFIKEIMVAIA